MSLGRLLTAGKSLVGLHSSTRYQLRTDALPKFESTKNPFAKAPAASADEKSASVDMASEHLKKTQRLPVITPKPQAVGERFQPAQPGEGVPLPPQGGAPSSPPRPAAPAQVSTPVESWVKKLNPLVWFAHRKSAEPKPAPLRSRKEPVQGELSLDNIKVMRNDLNDADVEVVPMKVRAVGALAVSAQASAAAMALPRLPAARNALEFLGQQLLRKD